MLGLSSNALERLNLKSDAEITVSVGVKKAKIKLKEFKNNQDAYSIHRTAIVKFGLMGIHQPLTFFFDEIKRELKAGPVVGVLCSRPVMMHDPEVESLFKTISKTAYETGMVCYFFTPDFVDYDNETISGFIYDSNYKKDWIIQEFPIPDVIYNQVGFITEELRPLYTKLVVDYVKRNKKVKLLNPFGLNDKLVNHNNFVKYPLIKDYLPETIGYKSADTVFYFLQKYGAAYLKPTSSSLGFGVYKISKARNGGYIVEHHVSKIEKCTQTFQHKKELLTRMHPIITAKSYLVQQPIRVIRFKNRLVAFRGHVFKNEKGRWNILIIKAKLGPEAGIITGPLWGGYRATALEILTETFGAQDAAAVIKGIEKCLFNIAGVIDDVYSGQFGELGFDIGVDVDRKIWMIEVNPKPNWNVPPGVDAEECEKNLAEHLLGYCRYLLKLTGLKWSRCSPAG